MAGVREGGALSEKPRRRARLCDRFANASIKTAFLLYAAGGILAALALSFAVTGALGLVADSTLVEDPYAYTGTYLYDAEKRALDPAEALSWYEIPASDAVYGDSASEGGAEEAEENADGSEASDSSKVVVLYVESQAYADSEDIPVDDPPAGAHDGTVVDIAVTYGTVSAAYDAEGANLSFADIPAYDTAAKGGRANRSRASRGCGTHPASRR